MQTKIFIHKRKDRVPVKKLWGGFKGITALISAISMASGESGL